MMTQRGTIRRGRQSHGVTGRCQEDRSKANPGAHKRQETKQNKAGNELKA